MKLLILSKERCDLEDVLLSCPVETEVLPFETAVSTDLDQYDAFCVLGNGGKWLETRLRSKLEAEADKGKKIFLESITSFRSVYSQRPTETVQSRLVYVAPENDEGIPGLTIGDLLDDECNQAMFPWFTYSEMVPLLVYRRINAHTHAKGTREELLQGSQLGMFRVGDNVIMAMFNIRNFNRARFAPRGNWEKLIRYIAVFLTGTEPASMPEPVVRYGTDADLSSPEVWEACRKQSVKEGIQWLEKFLIEGGKAGIKESLLHDIHPDGQQVIWEVVRNDCCGEAAGAFSMYGHLTNNNYYTGISDNIREFIQDNFMIREEPYTGMMRWSQDSWNVCYPDDVARSILPVLFNALWMNDDRYLDDTYLALDFLVNITCRDGLTPMRVNLWNLDAQKMEEIRQTEHGILSAHYVAFHLADMLLAYKKCGKPEYLQIGQRGIETLMEAYPNLRREQSETEEMCRLLLALAVLYDVTGEEKHKEYLYRVTADLEKHRHPFGGYCEWDTGYTAAFSCKAGAEESSVLTENGDPVSDSLYSMNWLPIAFAYAYYVTKDPYFHDLWKNVITFYMRTQMHSKDPILNGGWCRAFDMDLEEPYGCPHDIGWGPNGCETGWTVAEIVMGMMLPDILEP